jgi:hypothetical protein
MCTVRLPPGGNPTAAKKNISICIVRYAIIMFGTKSQPEELRPREGPSVHPTGDGQALAEWQLTEEKQNAQQLHFMRIWNGAI